MPRLTTYKASLQKAELVLDNTDLKKYKEYWADFKTLDLFNHSSIPLMLNVNLEKCNGLKS